MAIDCTLIFMATYTDAYGSHKYVASENHLNVEKYSCMLTAKVYA